MLQLTTLKIKTFAATTLFTLALAASASATTEGKWIHVKVDGKNDEKVTINLPMSLVTAASAMIPENVRADIDRDTRLAFDDVELRWDEVRNFLQELKKTPEATLVTVQSRDENIEIKKQGDYLLIATPRRTETGAEIDAKFPLAVIDALLSGPEGTLNFQAALNELAKYEGENLISVRDGEETVRIWIDDKNLAD